MGILKNRRFIQMLSAACFLAIAGLLNSCGGTRQKAQESNEYLIWPPPPDPPRIKYLRSLHSEMDVGRKRTFAEKVSEGIFGRSRLMVLKKPLTVHEDKLGRVYVVDTGWHKVIRFDFANKEMKMIGKRGRGMLFNPIGVTTDDSSRVYVTDADGFRVMVYDRNGKFITAYGGKDVFARPAGIVLNLALDRIYVVDTWAHQVKALDRKTGKVLFVIGKNDPKPAESDADKDIRDQYWNRGSDKGEFRFPTFIALDKDGNLYIVDTLNFRVQIFDKDGKFIHAFGKIGNLPGNFYRPKGIGIDSEGHIYVADASFNNIQIFDKDGRLLLSFGTFGSGLADLLLPAGMYINPQDEVFVVDQFNHRVQIYQYLGSHVMNTDGSK